MDIGSKTKSSLYWNVALKIVYELFRFATAIIIARILEPKDFGIVSIATMVIYYANSFTNFGFNQALVQRKDITDKQINSVFTFDLMVSVTMGLLALLSADAISRFFNSPESADVIRTLSLVFIITTLHDLPYILLRREIEFKVISIVDMLREMGMSILTLVLAYYGFSYWSIVWGHLIPLFLAAIYLLYKVKFPLKLSFRYASLRELFDFSIWSFIQMQIYFLSSRIDRIIIGKFLDTTMLGLYEKAKSLSQMPSESLGDKINTVLFSSFSRAQDKREEITRLFNKGLVVLTAINFPIYFGLYEIADHFVLVLLGDKWGGMIDAFKIMAIAGLFASVNGLVSALAVGAGQYRSYTIRFGISTFIFFILGMFAVEKGIEAVAVAFVLYSITLFIISYSLLKKAFHFSWQAVAVNVLPALVSSLIMAIVLEYVKAHGLENPTLSNMFMLIAIGGMVFVTSILLFPAETIRQVRQSVYVDVWKLWKKIRSK